MIVETVFLSVEALNTSAVDLFWTLAAPPKRRRVQSENEMCYIVSTSINAILSPMFFEASMAFYLRFENQLVS